MPFGIPSEDFHGGFGIPHDDDEIEPAAEVKSEEESMSNKIKTYHVRCGNFRCAYNHAAICYAGILTLNDRGVCECYMNKKEKGERYDS